LRRDKWLRAKIQGEPNSWVLVSDLMTFNKLKSMSEDKEAIQAAVKQSSALELSEDGSKLRRKTRDLPRQDDGVDVSVYSAGWPVTCKLEDLQQALKSAGLEPLFIKMRRERNEFVGSCFIEFEDEAKVAQCMEAQGKVKVGEDSKVVFEKMHDWVANAKKLEQVSAGCCFLVVLVGPDGYEADAHACKQTRGRSDAAASAAGALATEAAAKPSADFVSGSVLCLVGLKNACSREDIRQVLGEKDVAFVDHFRDAKDAKVRFHTAEQAQAGLEKAKGLADDSPLKCDSCFVLEGQEEAEYFVAAKEGFKRKRANQDTRGGGGGRGRGRGGRGGRGRGGGGRGGGNKRARAGSKDGE
jgi:lupus La protein